MRVRFEGALAYTYAHWNNSDGMILIFIGVVVVVADVRSMLSLTDRSGANRGAPSSPRAPNGYVYCPSNKNNPVRGQNNVSKRVRSFRHYSFDRHMNFSADVVRFEARASG